VLISPANNFIRQTKQTNNRQSRYAMKGNKPMIEEEAPQAKPATKPLNPTAVKWQEGFQVIRQLLTQKMMLSTTADIAHEGAFLAHRLATELDGKYRIHTRSQSSKSLQEKAEKAEAEVAGEAQGGVVEAEGITPAQTGEGSDESMAEQDTDHTSETALIA
jgi:hypothetical protein